MNPNASSYDPGQYGDESGSYNNNNIGGGLDRRNASFFMGYASTTTNANINNPYAPTATTTTDDDGRTTAAVGASSSEYGYTGYDDDGGYDEPQDATASVEGYYPSLAAADDGSYYGADETLSNNNNGQFDHLNYYYNNNTERVETNVETNGLFYARHNHDLVQSPLLYGTPISAVAYHSDEAICAATPTQAQSAASERRSSRAARMLTYTINDIGVLLYSAVASHPEAPPSVLRAIYSALYGTAATTTTTTTTTSTTSNKSAFTVPNHAHTPYFGSVDPALPDSGALSSTGNLQLGVTNLIPLVEGTVASVSPAGMRIHAVGGMLLADQHLEGMLAASSWNHNSNNNNKPESVVSHIMVGGMALAAQLPDNKAFGPHHLHCLDVWQGLQIVSSHTLDRANRLDNPNIAVTALATSHSRGCVAVGCSDGYLRLVDDRNRDLAAIKSHTGGVVGVAVSEDGTLVATTGYGSTAAMRSPTTPLFAYPDSTILVHDLRYLGRGGFPHAFDGLCGGPRHLQFLPECDQQPHHRLLVASGQVGGGCQVIVPFQDASLSNNFIIPHLDRLEYVSAMCVSNEKLALATNHGNIRQYRMAGFQRSETNDNGSTFNDSSSPARGAYGARSASSYSEPVEKRHLVLPSFVPPLSEVALEATLLLSEKPFMRMGESEKIRSIMGAYIFTGTPTLSSVSLRGSKHGASLSSFGPLASNPLVAQCRFKVSTTLSSKSRHVMDFVETIPASELNVDVFGDHRPIKIKERKKNESKLLQNPNKFIYSNDIFKAVYGESFNRSKRYERLKWSYGKSAVAGLVDNETVRVDIPPNYRLTLRSAVKSAASYSHSDYNQSGIIPGFDYPITMPNSFVSPILLLFYFIPELREATLKTQLSPTLSSPRDHGLVMELGYLFHRIDMISRLGPIFQAVEGTSDFIRIEAWSPASFISFISTMSEAERFQILDGSPAAVDPPRRPEAFYRFLMYQLDSEINRGRPSGLLDALGGIDFVSVNEFISSSGLPSKSTTRHLTVELSYDFFIGAEYKNDKPPSFGELLQHNLCRATRLRAWDQSSKSYETIVQRKIVTSLPSILSLSAACAGRKAEEGLSLWRNSIGPSKHWLPEVIEVEIQPNGSVLVRELVSGDSEGNETWKLCKGTASIPLAVMTVMKEILNHGGPRRRRYHLESVVAMIRDDLDHNCPEEILSMDKEGPFGHHILHSRISKDMKKRMLEHQLEAVEAYFSDGPQGIVGTELTKSGLQADRGPLMQQRRDNLQMRLAALDDATVEDQEWVVVNGFVVANTTVDDARSFESLYKEPCLIVFRATDHVDLQPAATDKKRGKSRPEDSSSGAGAKVPPEIIQSASITDSSKSRYASNQKPSALPGKNDLVAFDAEFVAVAEEEAIMITSGSKLTIRETRHALARISVLDGRPGRIGSIVLDDHVHPNEAVTDYLTRFSGVVAQDLSPKHSRHHLISARTAYLKLRCLVERGCVFVGHGLRQDFWTANLAVPAYQIIDTVDIYHKPAQRYISLRFLTNFILKRDMQQDVHNSVEDAQAAFALYLKALELKESGVFDRVLDELYAYGNKCDWKLGVDDDDDDDNTTTELKQERHNAQP